MTEVKPKTKQLQRIADALERIADALERVTGHSGQATPTARKKPTDEAEGEDALSKFRF